ncbi:hypothetical protein [Viscerimonas tarda]
MGKIIKRYGKYAIFVLLFLVNIGIEIQDGAISVEAGVKACAYSNEYDEITFHCTLCGNDINNCSCYGVVICAYCKQSGCDGLCRYTCSYCGMLFCYGDCQFGYGISCQYCGSLYCDGTCEWSQACWYCGDIYCYGWCLNTCNYCGSSYCYGSCQNQNVCNYCGQSGCYGGCLNVCSNCGQSWCQGECQQDDCGPTCNICGGSLGGSLRRGKLRSGSSCTGCVCTDPCAMANAILNNPSVNAAFNDVHGKVNQLDEWGMTVSAKFLNPDGTAANPFFVAPTFVSSNLYTDGQRTSIGMQESWNNSDGYSFSMVHSHPNGGENDCFSVADIYTLKNMLNHYNKYKHDQDSLALIDPDFADYYQKQLNFIENNTSLVVIGLGATYAVTVKDWEELDNILSNNTVNTAKAQVEIYKSNAYKYDHDAALLKYFGSAINLHKSPRDELDFNQYYQPDPNDSKKTKLIGCP